MNTICLCARQLVITVCLVTFGLPSVVAAQEAVSTVVPSLEVTAPFVAKAKERWETEIQKLEALDKSEVDPPNAILLLGSSSIRLWEDAATDMAPYPVIRRGYGGARYSDLAVYADRLVRPHTFRAAVIFVANDLTGSKEDITPKQVGELANHVISVVQKHQPQAEIFLIEVTPTPSRFAVWSEIRQVNQVLRELAFTQPHVNFINTAEHYLSQANEPRPEFFVKDKLHQNRDGYTLWAKLIKRNLDDHLPPLVPQP